MAVLPCHYFRTTSFGVKLFAKKSHGYLVEAVRIVPAANFSPLLSLSVSSVFLLFNLSIRVLPCPLLALLFFPFCVLCAFSWPFRLLDFPNLLCNTPTVKINSQPLALCRPNTTPVAAACKICALPAPSASRLWYPAHWHPRLAPPAL